MQFGSLVVIILLLVLYPPRYRATGWLVIGLAAYVAAMGLESADRLIFDALRFVSGHTLKHVVAAAGVGRIAAMLGQRSAARSTAVPFLRKKR